MTLLESRSKLYDGTEEQELYYTAFMVNNHKFTLSEIVRNNFKDLKDTLSVEDILRTAATFNVRANPDGLKPFKDYSFRGFDAAEYDSFLNTNPSLYQSEENLSLYYIIKDNHLYIFSWGEKQPARYMLFVESVWDLKKMVFAVYDFAYITGDLNAAKLKLLLNIEDLNNPVFNTVFGALQPHQQEQYIIYKSGTEAIPYREARNTSLPYVDFTTLPEYLDPPLLAKVMAYQKEGEIRTAVYDALTEKHKTQIARFEWGVYEEEKERKRALMTDGEKRREQQLRDNAVPNLPPQFLGNMGEPDTVEGYISKYGVDPRTGIAPEKVETIIQQPWDYTLTKKENGDFVLTVLCGTVAFFELAIILNDDEASLYKQEGEQFVAQLAGRIRNNPSHWTFRQLKHNQP